MYFAHQLLEGKDVGLFIHRGPLYGRAGQGAWGWQPGPLVSGMSEGPVDHRGGFSCSEEHGTVKDCLVNSFWSPCMNVVEVLWLAGLSFACAIFRQDPVDVGVYPVWLSALSS